MSISAPFSPGETLTLAVTDASSNASFGAAGAQASVIEVQNLGTLTCFIAFGATATTAGYPIGAGQSKVVSKAPGCGADRGHLRNRAKHYALHHGGPGALTCFSASTRGYGRAATSAAPCLIL